MVHYHRYVLLGKATAHLPLALLQESTLGIVGGDGTGS